MKAKFKGFCALLLATLTLTLFTACGAKTGENLDLNNYLKSDVEVSLYKESKTSTQSLATFTGAEDYIMGDYGYINFVFNPRFSNGLYVTAVDFDIVSTSTAELSFEIYLSHLKEAEFYNKTDEYFYLKKSFNCSPSKDKTAHVHLEINGELTNNEAKLSVQIDESYLHTSGFSFTITNLKIYGYHTSPNY